MLLTLNADFLDASERQVVDTIKTAHDARYQADIERLARDCMARTPDEPRVPRRPLLDRHNVDGARR